MIDYKIFYVLKDFLYICMWVHVDTCPSKNQLFLNVNIDRGANVTILADPGLSSSFFFFFAFL